MREILFRGRATRDYMEHYASDKPYIKKGDWLFGNLIIEKSQYANGYYIKEIEFPFRTHEVDPKTVEQRIARVFVRGDVADLPIYCGDIIEFQYKGRYTVGLVEVEFGVPIIVSRRLADGFIYLSEVLKVDENQAVFEGCRLGNIHDNPELLEVE